MQVNFLRVLLIHTLFHSFNKFNLWFEKSPYLNIRIISLGIAILLFQ